MIVHDAATAFVALYDAALAWAAVLAFAVIVVGWAGCLTGAWAVKAARSRLNARLTAEHASKAPAGQPAHKRRPVPSWAHTEPYT